MRKVTSALLLGSALTVIAHGASAQQVAPRWSGIYIGAGVGMASATVDHQSSDDRVNYFPGWSDGGKGAFGTVIAGYDHQFTPSMVAGAFVDYDFGGSKVKWNDFGGGGTLQGNFDQSHTFSVGARLGMLVNPSVLLYVTGGWTNAKFSAVDFQFLFNGADANRIIPSQSFSGFFIGAGVETMLTSNMSLRLDYRFSDFGERVLDRTFQTTGNFSTQVKNDLSTQAVRAVLSYKF